VLAGEELAAAVFAHGSWAGGTIGFACGHFGEEALKGRRKRIKTPCSQETTKSQTKYITQGRQDIDEYEKKKPTGEYNEAPEKKKQWKRNQDATTYFGCTVVPGDSCGVPSHAVPPSDASPASFVPPRWDDPGIAARRRSPGHCRTGASASHRTR
jgi:hypothetical protein